jgi:chemotaxis signal transduction protein
VKNVVVVALAGNRYAIELRWVREIITLTHVTRVPGSSGLISGVANWRGAIVPVLGIGEGAPAGSGRAGSSAVLVEVDGVCGALAIDSVDMVATLPSAPDGRRLTAPNGQPIPLVHPPELFRRASAASPDRTEQAK